MKFLLILTANFLNLVCSAQNSCVYKPKKFEEYRIDLSSEYAGLFPNGINLRKKQFQYELNSYLGAIFNSYNRKVSAGFLQLRYAIISATEIQLNGFIQNPPIINVDTLYNQKLNIGLKQKILRLDGKHVQWNLALSAKYIFQRSWMKGNNTRNGFMFTANNSIKANNYLYMDLSGGINYFHKENLFLPAISGKILIKDELSKIGIFLGFCGDHYTESLLDIGLQYSDNQNYLILLTIGFLDNAITPGVSFTQVFNN